MISERSELLMLYIQVSYQLQIEYLTRAQGTGHCPSGDSLFLHHRFCFTSNSNEFTVQESINPAERVLLMCLVCHVRSTIFIPIKITNNI